MFNSDIQHLARLGGGRNPLVVCVLDKSYEKPSKKLGHLVT